MSSQQARRGIVLGACFFLASLAACTSVPLRESTWVVVESPRFEIFSTMAPERTAELASELERFHALVYELTGAPEIESSIPTRIFAFATRSEYRRFGSKSSAGHFQSGLRWNHIVLVDYSRKLGAGNIILHEYVHFVVRNGNPRLLPIWWDEGYAELLSTVDLRDDVVAIGDLPEARRLWLERGRWLPLRRVVSATSYADFTEYDLGMFYAQAWAVVHYLIIDRDGDRSIERDLADYLAQLEDGIDPDAAFESAFGESTSDMSDSIWRKMKRGMRIVGLPEARLDYDRSPPTVRPPRAGEVAVRLGQLRLLRGEAEAAEADFSAAVAAAPGDSRAHAGLGDALKFQERWNEAEVHLERAVELAPDDPLNVLDLAEFHHDKALVQEDSVARRILLEHARKGYRAVLERNPSMPEPWLVLGRTHLAPGEDPALALEPIERALELLPSSSEVLASMAEAYVAIGRYREAFKLMVRAYAARTEGSVEEAARKRVEAIREYREALDSGAADESD